MCSPGASRPANRMGADNVALGRGASLLSCEQSLERRGAGHSHRGLRGPGWPQNPRDSTTACMRRSNTVEQGPELSHTADYRERIEHARNQARSLYRDHLAAVFDQHRVAEPGALADAALDALTEWRYVDTGERCRCSCHPRLPETDLHDYGFACGCTRTPADRQSAFGQWRNSFEKFKQSPECQRIA